MQSNFTSNPGPTFVYDIDFRMFVTFFYVELFGHISKPGQLLSPSGQIAHSFKPIVAISLVYVSILS